MHDLNYLYLILMIILFVEVSIFFKINGFLVLFNSNKKEEKKENTKEQIKQYIEVKEDIGNKLYKKKCELCGRNEKIRKIIINGHTICGICFYFKSPETIAEIFIKRLNNDE
jgi:hypothetical protein